MTAPTIAEKRCTKCGETKSVDGFSRDRSRRDGLSPHCKACRRAYYEAHREEKRANSRSYRDAHREELRAYDAAYLEAHREEHRAYNRAYGRDRRALLGNQMVDRWQEITAKHATRAGEPWSEADDTYLAASTDRDVDDALKLKRTYNSVTGRIARLRKRGIELARDAHRR